MVANGYCEMTSNLIFVDSTIVEHNKAKTRTEQLEKTISKRDGGRGRKKEFVLNSTMAQDSDDEKFDNASANKHKV